jgi:putative transposase
VHDVKLLEPTLARIVVARPGPNEDDPQHFCADAGYKGQSALAAVQARAYQAHIKQRKEEAEAKRTQPGWKARRWVVERSHSWFNRFANCRSASRKPKPALRLFTPWPQP